jgi:hypothetical protein
MRALLKNRQQMRIFLFAVGGICILIPLIQVMRKGLGVGIGIGWIYIAAMGFLGALVGAFDLANRRSNNDEETQAITLRLELMVLGGLFGLGLAMLGFFLAFTSYREQISGGLESWRDNWRPLSLLVLAIVGGQFLTFASVQLLSGLERQNQMIRRIYYGCVVVLTTVLLIEVLIIPNALAYSKPFNKFFGRPFDWTQSNINSISPLLRNYMANLQEPVKVYVLAPRGHPITADVQTLLENCRSLNSKVNWEIVDPRALENRNKIMALMEKYTFTDSTGLLVLVGSEDKTTKPDFAFVKFNDLFEEDRAAPGTARSGLSYSFLGENALYNALSSLTEGKMTIYFTSGHGELTPDSAMPRMPGMPMPESGGLSSLQRRLTDRKSVEVKTLPLRNLKAIPDDASVVVVARPTQTFSDEEVAMLRTYLKRPARSDTVKEKDGREHQVEKVTAGKLILLLDPVIRKQDNKTFTARTGFEELLLEYQVQLGANRLVTVPGIRGGQLAVIAEADDKSVNPVARAFAPEGLMSRQFLLRNVRTVAPIDGKGGGKSVDRLLITDSGVPVVADSALDADPDALAAALRSDRERRARMVSKEPLSVAVAVSESSAAPGIPRDRAHASMTEDTPRMLVFGSSSWISDDMMSGGLGTQNADLFISGVSWLRGKASIGQTIDAKKRKQYVLGVAEKDANRLAFLPLGLLLLGIVGLGTGVWVVRRR